MKSTLIKNGRIVDGSGNKEFAGDILIEKDKISVVGEVGDTSAKQVIDAQGKIVCPGFIDIHSHADIIVYKDDHPEILVRVTIKNIGTTIARAGSAIVELKIKRSKM